MREGSQRGGFELQKDSIVGTKTQFTNILRKSGEFYTLFFHNENCHILIETLMLWKEPKKISPLNVSVMGTLAPSPKPSCSFQQ